MRFCIVANIECTGSGIIRIINRLISACIEGDFICAFIEVKRAVGISEIGIYHCGRIFIIRIIYIYNINEHKTACAVRHGIDLEARAGEGELSVKRFFIGSAFITIAYGCFLCAAERICDRILIVISTQSAVNI